MGAEENRPGPETAPTVPAPGLREVAQTRWDVDRDPVVAWASSADDAAGPTTWWLADPDDDDRRIHLLHLDTAPPDPSSVAAALAETVAACDFPPTDDHASVPRVRAALRAAGFRDLLARGDDDRTRP